MPEPRPPQPDEVLDPAEPVVVFENQEFRCVRLPTPPHQFGSFIFEKRWVDAMGVETWAPTEPPLKVGIKAAEFQPRWVGMLCESLLRHKVALLAKDARAEEVTP
jgi:hypothetical protein